MSKFIDFVSSLGGRSTDQPAIELGQSWLRSSVGEALTVDIPLLNVAERKLAALRVASYCALSDAGAPDPSLTSGDSVALTSSLRHEGGGQYFIRLASKSALVKDNLYLRVTLDDNGERIQREYRHRLRGTRPERREPFAVSSVAVEHTRIAPPSPAVRSINAEGATAGAASSLLPGNAEHAFATHEWLEKEIAQLQSALDHLRQAASRQRQTLVDQAEKAALHRTLVQRIGAQSREMARLVERLQPTTLTKAES